MMNSKQKLKTEKAITLIALIITVIVLLILAGVTINLTLGDNGIFKVAEQAARNYKDAENKELGLLDQFNTELDEITDFDDLKQYNDTLNVNKPKLLAGMTPIVFEKGSNNEYEAKTTTEDNTNWYNYTNQQWANAQTEDGSMWVWIPRYAYKINKDTETTDVVFLVGSTDNYYDVEDGNKLKTAKRAKSANDTVDTTTGYTVHPAFTDESSINYANGGWDEDLTGIWVAKFEAGYASGNNTQTVKRSTVNYTQTQVYAPEGWVTATNFVDETYDTTTKISYPVFQGVSFSYNYISIGDAYNISRAMTENGNIYGLKGNNADSHLMKNSEWGAIAYLTKSSYGIGTDEIYINNVTLNNDTKNVYAVTGCSGIGPNESEITTKIADIKARTTENVYVWCQENGTKASTTGTVYGVYDMSGGAWERTAGYVANNHGNLKAYGASVAYNGETLKTVSTKYTTVYPHDSSVDNASASNIDTTSEANYAVNTRIYGDAVRETSTAGKGAESWDGDYSYFWSLNNPFSARDGGWGNRSNAGVTAFNRTGGAADFSNGFRAVLCAL